MIFKNISWPAIRIELLIPDLGDRHWLHVTADRHVSGDAAEVNVGWPRIVKFYHKSLNEKISYAHLMCGQLGLVHALLYIFSYG